MDKITSSLFWSIIKKHNTRLQSWFALLAWVLAGVKTFWQLTQTVGLPTVVQQGTQVVTIGVQQIPPSHLAALPVLLGVWVAGFGTIMGLAAYKSNRDQAQANKLTTDAEKIGAGIPTDAPKNP
jgi:hypothetical protein